MVYPLYLLSHFSAHLYNYYPQNICLWLLTQIYLLFSLEYTTIRLSSLHCFVKDTNDLCVLNLKHNSLFIFLEEFDIVDFSLLLETLSSLRFQDNIAFLFLSSTLLIIPSQFPWLLFLQVHYTGVLRGSELETLIFAIYHGRYGYLYPVYITPLDIQD